MLYNILITLYEYTSNIALNFKGDFNMEISILFCIIFIYEYIQKKNKYILLGIPLIIYCFCILPFLYEKLDKFLILSITLIVCIPICISVFRGTKSLQK